MREAAEFNGGRGYSSYNHRVKSNAKADMYYIEVLGKTLDVLDVFGRSGHNQLSLQDLAAATKLNKNTVFASFTRWPNMVTYRRKDIPIN
jgi:IclR helix-turn-helix domain